MSANIANRLKQYAIEHLRKKPDANDDELRHVVTERMIADFHDEVPEEKHHSSDQRNIRIIIDRVLRVQDPFNAARKEYKARINRTIGFTDDESVIEE